MSYLRFSPMKESDEWPAGSVAVLSARQGTVLGVLSYYAPWREWVLEAAPDVVWSDGCLGEVTGKIARLNAERGSPHPVDAGETGRARRANGGDS